ncbi:MAG: decarboxylating 6-phosphogluconate dehydrogenase [Gammaproteobacteria bacterium]|nr:decarboxylating 6-phosphogluconate dehydrogenase [Gammaproteobacteria bacterium]
MQMAMIGLGKMGANMARRLCRGGIQVMGFNRSPDITQQLAKEEGMQTATSLADIVQQLPSPRIIWLMLPSGEPTENAIHELMNLLQAGDLIIDGGNSNYHDSQRRGQLLSQHDIGFVDAGTSGGVWGLQNGYCLMVGGEANYIKLLTPALKVLAPAEDRGWAHVGPVGAGHFTKMIHNGIEYGMMQAFAEGFSLMKGKQEFNLDLAQISELWRHSSVVRSWLLDLMAEFLNEDQQLDKIAPYVSDSGEGRWTVDEATAQGTPAPVLAMALHMRFASQGNADYGNKLLSMMRNAFGGHTVKDN